MAVRADVAVVGLGAMGSATALQLARCGLRVVGIDRFVPPHAHGSTHGETRITRLALGEGSEFVPLVRRSHALWRELEAAAGVRLFEQPGGLTIAPRDNGFLAETRRAAELHGIAHENLTNVALRERFPMFGIGDAEEAYFEPEAGWVRPEAAVAAQLRLAAAAGAELRLGCAVRSWSASGSGVTLATDTGTLEAEQLVLCAGPWIGELFPQARPWMAVHPQLLHWFPVRSGYPALEKMPVFIWEVGGEKAEFAHGTGFYGFPAIDGPAGGVKLATEQYARTIDPDDPRGPDSADAFVAAFVAQRFPWVGAAPLRTVSCLYTNTRGSRFVIARPPEHPRVFVVSACSGHGFKHAPAIGEAVAQTIAGQPTSVDLAPFAWPTEAAASGVACRV